MSRTIRVPLFPLPGAILFPRAQLPLHIFEPRYRDMVRDAADALLEIVRRDREWNDGAARQRFLQLLEAQGHEDPWSSAQRRRLSAVLFT